MSHPFAWGAMRAGAFATLPLLPSLLVYALLLGVLSGKAGVSPWAMGVESLLVFAGSSQFVVAGLRAAGETGLLALWLAVFALNLRYVLMCASLAPLLSGVSRPAAFASIHWVADENWALTMAAAKQGRASPGFLLGAGLALGAFWVPCTMLGCAFGAGLSLDPERWGLDFAFPAIFLALALGLWRGVRADLLPWITAGVLALLTREVLPEGKWYILTGGIGGALAVLLPLPGLAAEPAADSVR